jgi:hypothetical protein
MKLHLHDDDPAKPGEKHGKEGPTHCATVTVDYEYQVEMWVHDEIGADYPQVVFARCPELRRAWRRVGSTKKFEEVPYLESPYEPLRA